MRVLLINPSFEDIYGSYKHLYRKGFLNSPLSLCYLAASLIDNDHVAQIVDGEAESLSLDQIIKKVKDFAPGLIGITATSIDFIHAHHLAKALKKVLPEIPLLLGGTHVNLFGSEVLEKAPEFDFGCIGDGEYLIVELAQMIEEGASDKLPNIAGLIYRDGKNTVQNCFRPIEMNLDRYTFPARFLLKNELYYRAIPFKGYQTTASIMSSRGCPFSCAFCAVRNIYGGPKVRLRSASNVLNEIEYIVKEMGINHLAFNDDCLTLNRERMMTICTGILERGLKFTWEGLSRADLLDEELLRIMKQAGFIRISIGIESANAHILKVLKKHETLEQIEKAVYMAKRAGIVTRGSLIIGSPYETGETVKESFRFINQLKSLDQVVINIMQPYPGTEIREMVLRGEGGTHFYQQENQNDSLQRFGSAAIRVNELTQEKLVSLQKKGFLGFYLRPRAVINNLRITGLKTFCNDSIGFLRSIIGL